MVKLRHPSRQTRGTGVGMEYFLFLIVATIVLILWAYQRVYTGESNDWLLIIAVLLAVSGFALTVISLFKGRRKQK